MKFFKPVVGVVISVVVFLIAFSAIRLTLQFLGVWLVSTAHGLTSPNSLRQSNFQPMALWALLLGFVGRVCWWSGLLGAMFGGVRTVVAIEPFHKYGTRWSRIIVAIVNLLSFDSLIYWAHARPDSILLNPFLFDSSAIMLSMAGFGFLLAPTEAELNQYRSTKLSADNTPGAP